MVAPYEDPRKSSMRTLLSVALDIAGIEEVEPEPIPVPDDVSSFGKILGDAHSVADGDVRTIYILRPDPSKPLPGWAVQFARAAHQIDNLRIVVVVDHMTVVIEKTCRAAGVGLLLLDESATLTIYIDPEDIDPAQIEKDCLDQVRDLRRRLDKKVGLIEAETAKRFADTTELTSNMSDEMQKQYIGYIEAEAERADDWARGISELLDKAETECVPGELEDVSEALLNGPPRVHEAL